MFRDFFKKQFWERSGLPVDTVQQDKRDRGVTVRIIAFVEPDLAFSTGMFLEETLIARASIDYAMINNTTNTRFSSPVN